jgi:hypothetical protein
MKLLYVVLDSEGPTTYHGSRAATALDVVYRLGADLPRSLPGSEIVAALTRSQRLWIMTQTGREVAVRCDEVDR